MEKEKITTSLIDYQVHLTGNQEDDERDLITKLNDIMRETIELRDRDLKIYIGKAYLDQAKKAEVFKKRDTGTWKMKQITSLQERYANQSYGHLIVLAIATQENEKPYCTYEKYVLQLIDGMKKKHTHEARHTVTYIETAGRRGGRGDDNHPAYIIYAAIF